MTATEGKRNRGTGTDGWDQRKGQRRRDKGTGMGTG